jgi:hypothetical protein
LIAAGLHEQRGPYGSVWLRVDAGDGGVSSAVCSAVKDRCFYFPALKPSSALCNDCLRAACLKEGSLYITFSQWIDSTELLRVLRVLGFKYFRNDERRQEHVFYKW